MGQAAQHAAQPSAAWVTQQLIAANLTAAMNGHPPQPGSFSAALAYQDMQGPAPAAESPPAEAEDDSFGFADIIDFVNPLQHIPIVSYFYRQITGDTIKPIAQIVGGAVFGGPIGAAGGLVNAVVEEETGRDLTGNAIALAQGEDIEWKGGPLLGGPPYNPQEQQHKRPDDAIMQAQATQLAALAPASGPETALTRAALTIESEAYRALPPAVLSFADSSAAVPRKNPGDDRPVSAYTGGNAWRRFERYND